MTREVDGGIHSLRKRMKKLRAMLSLGKACLDEEERSGLQADLKRLKNVFSARRDAQVMAGLRGQWGDAVGKPAATVKLPPVTAKARAEAEALAEALARQVRELPLGELTWEEVARRYARSHRRARKAWKRTRQDDAAETLHAWRRLVKRLYYQSAALAPWLGSSKRLLRLKKLGSLLGDCHDLDVLVESIRKGDLTGARGWHAEADERRQEMVQMIQKRALRVFKRKARKQERWCQKRLGVVERR